MPKTIVLVDDEILVRETVQMALSARGYKVKVVDDPVKAMDAIRRAKPDLIILDLYMPNVDGASLCKELKKEEGLRDIPVLFFSGSSKPADIMGGLKAGGYDWVAKPVDGEELIRKVESILNLKT
ncbi:MAG: response regulator transcription factor [Elusimicrobia bacterium]|nr:response regulator transcription factor [Elusimicrobiota bacterium]